MVSIQTCTDRMDHMHLIGAGTFPISTGTILICASTNGTLSRVKVQVIALLAGLLSW